jgi:ketosteroid isomerase-like protein
MAHPNEERIRRGYQAFSAGDMTALDALLSDDVVWHAPGNNPLSGDFVGKDAVFDLFAKLMETTGGTFRIELHDVLANDEHGVALAMVSAEREGRRLEDRQAQVFHFEGGRVTEFWTHPENQAAVDEFLS